jgi:hypothetical protein
MRHGGRIGQTADAKDKILFMKIFLSLLTLILTGHGAHAHNYKYNDLMIRDYDEMNKQVQARIKKATQITNKEEGGEADREAIEELRDALKLIFSRPNSDNMVAKLIPEVRRELANMSAYEDSIAAVATEALTAAKNQDATLSHRATSLFILANILSEIRPESEINADFRRIVQRVADAKIKIADDVAKDLKIRSMYKLQNPSDLAAEILKSLPKETKKNK